MSEPQAPADQIHDSAVAKFLEQASEDVLSVVRKHPNYVALIDRISQDILTRAGL